MVGYLVLLLLLIVVVLSLTVGVEPQVMPDNPKCCKCGTEGIDNLIIDDIPPHQSPTNGYAANKLMPETAFGISDTDWERPGRTITCYECGFSSAYSSDFKNTKTYDS